MIGKVLRGKPEGEVFDASGDVFIADSASNRAQEIAATSHTQYGITMTARDVYTIAGSAAGTSGISGDGGAATAAFLKDPEGLVLDSSGNLYIADAGNHRVQKVAASTGTISTFAGSATGSSGTSGDCLATSSIRRGAGGSAPSSHQRPDRQYGGQAF